MASPAAAAMPLSALPRETSRVRLVPRSSLHELATLARWWRCYDCRSPRDKARFKDVFEVNSARAQREASLSLGCSERLVRVEPLPTAPALQTRGEA